MIEIEELISRSQLAKSFRETQTAIALLELAHAKYRAWWEEATPLQKFEEMRRGFETDLLLQIEALKQEAK